MRIYSFIAGSCRHGAVVLAQVLSQEGTNRKFNKALLRTSRIQFENLFPAMASATFELLGFLKIRRSDVVARRVLRLRSEVEHWLRLTE